MEAEHSRPRTTMWVHAYTAGKLEIECSEQTLIASCAGNHESDFFVINFHTAEF